MLSKILFLSQQGPTSSTQPVSASTIMPTKSTANPIFEETSHKAIRSAHQRRNRSLFIFTAVLLTIGGVYAATRIQKSKEVAVVQEYLSADSKFNQELEEFQSKMTAEGDKFDFNQTPNHDKSVQEFLKFAEKHFSHPLGWQASLRGTSYLIEQKKFEEAKPILEKLAQQLLSNNIAQARIRRSLATVHAGLANYEAAIKELEFAEKLPDNPNLNETKLLKAQMLYLAGKKPEAGNLLRELTTTMGTDSELSGRSVATEAALWLGFWKL